MAKVPENCDPINITMLSNHSFPLSFLKHLQKYRIVRNERHDYRQILPVSQRLAHFLTLSLLFT